MDSETRICNLALARAQVGKRLQAMRTDTSTEAGACQDVYDHCRDELLERYRWPFAEMQASLTAIGSDAWDSTKTYAKKATVSLSGGVYLSLVDANLNKQPDQNANSWRRITWTGWSYAFALPADLVAVREVYSGVRLPTDVEEVPRALAHDPDLGTLLLCDLQTPDLRYTRRVDAPIMYPETFGDALAFRISVELALTLKRDPQLALALRQATEQAIELAFHSQQKQQHEMPRASRFIESRGGGFDQWTPPVRLL